MFKFITHKGLVFNILFGVFIVLLLVVLFFVGLGWITNHGKYEVVPNITGKNIQAAKLLLEAKGFTVEVADSTFEMTQPKLSVIKQSPAPESIVKKGRTIYLTVNRQVPPMIDMPNLVGMSLKRAIMEMEALGLTLGDTTFAADFTKNSVLEMKLNGMSIKPLTKIFVGSRIDLVISSGPGDEIDVPDLFALPYRDALSLVGTNQLKIGGILADADVKDTMNAFVYRQSPEAFFEPIPKQKVNTKIRIGQLIDVWLSVKQPIKDSTGNFIIDSSNLSTQ